MNDTPDRSGAGHLEPPPLGGDAECLMYWRRADGTVVTTGPLPRHRAEGLAAAYRRISPAEQYWVDPLPPQLRAAQQGRVRRRPPIGPGRSGTGH